MNAIKTVLLLGVLTGILLWAGEAISGTIGLEIALLLAAGLNFASWFFSDKIALAAHHAQPVSESEAPQLYSILHELTASAGLPMPRVYLIPEAQPNAFATGRGPSHAAVAVTQGLVQSLDHEEIKGVLAHELAHVKHHDILTMSVAATLAGAITVLARLAGWALMFGGYGGRDNRGGGLGGLFFLIVAPIAAVLIQLAVSRSREFAADEGGARIAGSPYGLASALRKLSAYTQRIPMRTAKPTTAHMMIANPFGRGMRLFATHPPMEERIRRLEAMGR
ncbi:MAG: zinc metalloprotease HtpX [Acidobacteria bacterium]|jgi:heat shock protein HtpX|nr:zinc metalloprotease HtpX [Acidobacteriota bacterium]